MHLVACITLLRESLSGMAKDSTKCLYGTVTIILEIAFSSNTVYLFDCLAYVYLVPSIDIYIRIQLHQKNMLTQPFRLALHFCADWEGFLQL